MRWNPRFSVAIIPIFALLAIGQSQAQTPDASSNASGGHQAGATGNVEVLSDTQGVDFGPYLTKQVQQIKTNWYNFIPEEARPPQLKSGEMTIEFAILKNGRVTGMKIVKATGSVALDRAAWGGITASIPFDPFPDQFKGDHLALRMHFFYNPKRMNSYHPSAPPSADSRESPPVPH